MNNIERALLISDKAHANQSYCIYPYGYNTRLVMKIAVDIGNKENIIVASALHDVLEDTHVSYNELKTAFCELFR